MPQEWKPFLGLMGEYLEKVKDHPTYEACLRMTNRTVRKMGAVALDPRDDIYVQTGFAQRGLGFGWRLNDMGRGEEIRPYFEQMPVSLGVVALSADQDTLIARNKARAEVAATAHEDRSHMVPLMRRPMEIALEELSKRVPVLCLDTRMPLDQARSKLIAFRDSFARTNKVLHHQAFRPDYQEALVSAFLKF